MSDLPDRVAVQARALPWTEFSHPMDMVRSNSRHRGAIAAVQAGAYEILAARAEKVFSGEELDEWRALVHQRRRSSYLLGRYAAKRA